ncbi:MAG TPA: dihydrolipoamide acetyltransferase family protein [Pseudonocardiaceae bacterium]|nr:dihydrolipoamide acetyltransferase family protein [Pseudonocardiaceae bacterium]
MATLLRVPEVATGSTEAVLTEWLVAENVAFAAGAAIAVLETDKAAVEVEAETDSMILRRLVNGGTTVEVGTPIAVLGVAGEDVTALLAELGSPADSAGAERGAARAATELSQASAAGAEAAAAAGAAPAQPGAVGAAPAQPGAAGAAPAQPGAAAVSGELGPAGKGADAEPGALGGAALGSSAVRVFASPLARKLLKEAGIAPAAVTGSGPNGRIVRKDAEAAIAESRAAAPSAPAPQPPVSSASPQLAPQPASPLAASPPAASQRSAAFVEVPHSRVRHAIATRLTASKQTVPHFYVRRTARIDSLLALRKQLNEVSAVKISVNDLIIKAVAIAHLAVPDANAIWTDDAMRRYTAVDVGVAIASARGLVTPVLRGVESSSVSAVSAQVKAFAKQADDGKLMQRDLEGGTITVSNLGMYGVDEFSAIINPPQSAILAVGAGQPGPAVVDGELIVATQLNLVLSVDHRAIDGALAAQWLAALVDAIEHPLRLLT